MINLDVLQHAFEQQLRSSPMLIPLCMHVLVTISNKRVRARAQQPLENLKVVSFSFICPHDVFLHAYPCKIKMYVCISPDGNPSVVACN